MPMIRINGTDHEVSDEVASHLSGLSQRVDSPDPERVAARAQLVLAAQRVLGAAERLDGLSDRELRARVIETIAPERRVDSSMSDDYVAGRFDALLAVRQQQGPTGVRRNEGLAIVQGLIDSSARQRIDAAQPTDAVQARLDAIQARYDGQGAEPARPDQEN